MVKLLLHYLVKKASQKLKKDTFKLVPNIKKVDLSIKSIEKIDNTILFKHKFKM